ncbi:iron-containing alcohol dehydrogenase family protein [Spongiactinospora sp. TRM90649]|uniref:iron-containing alcohol dehydrogenase family protein n=1 Tax=Spongiactinospora sp. TRM90649 TaxID=3031114 RepID=UPI0023F8B6E3|nr:iron-containing alcohol dehydrogenase family protein [Spongiactinospora sp. TRM90649]MDF5751194.1 iron-containing alcohol dehydrogenase family protein [Spongiactinospora sp. TRM90649]
MLPAPLTMQVRRGAIADLGSVLADSRVATSGRVAVAVGAGQGDKIASVIAPSLGEAQLFRVLDGSVDAAVSLGADLRKGAYEAVVGIGGGKTIDATKYAASLAGIPMVAVATNLSHDGICSPVASLVHEGGKGSFGVPMPLAIMVDLDFVHDAPPSLVRAGVGDVVSNLSAIEDWQLGAAERGEPIDGLACSMSRTAAEAVVGRTDSIESDAFLTVLAEALILSGMSMVIAGSSRPSSGGDHEILHAVDQLYPGTSNHGELAGIGAAFCFFLRDDAQRLTQVVECLRGHRLPVTPGDVGLSGEQFAEAVTLAPSTRPGRYTILEHLRLSESEVRERVEDYVRAVGR